MQLLYSFTLLFTLAYTSMAAFYGNTTVAAQYRSGSGSTTTLSPTYSVAPVTTVITYADPTTTFFVTQTLFSTIYYTPSSPSSPSSQAPSPSPSTVTSEYVSTYSDVSTTYTSTITSTMVIYATKTLNNKELKANGITATYTTTVGVQGAAVAPTTTADATGQCKGVTQFVTVTETAKQVTVTTTATPEIKYVTVTLDNNYKYSQNNTNSTL